MAICCPITSKIKGYPFEVRISGGKLDGVVLVDHVKHVDLIARGAKFAGKAPKEVVSEVTELLIGLIASDPA
jgi:mRNA interferase MazF